MLRVIVTISVFAAGLVACAGTNGPTGMNDEEENQGSEKEFERRIEARRGSYKRLPERVPADSPETVVGEVPESMLTVIGEDLAGKLNIAVDAIGIVRAEALTWNDGSLGCPRPGEMYTQALVPGYWIVLQHGDTQYDYRATERGYFFPCELPRSIERRQEVQ